MADAGDRERHGCAVRGARRACVRAAAKHEWAVMAWADAAVAGVSTSWSPKREKTSIKF